MPILRLGPWGKFGDAISPDDETTAPRPESVNLRTDYRPVNCARNLVAFGTEWEAYYQTNTSPCTTKKSITASFPSTNDFGSTFTQVIETIPRGTNGQCYYGYAENPEGYYRGDVFFMSKNESTGMWDVTFGNEDFAQTGYISINFNVADIDPQIFPISGTTYYDGESITITNGIV